MISGQRTFESKAHDKSGPLIPASYTTLVEEVARDSCAWLANMLVLVALA
jgi:hypothetical protein